MLDAQANARAVPESLREYGRGVAGGLLFSLPLLYTAEVWWAGFTMPAERQLAYLGFTLILLLGYNRYAGLRHEPSWTEIAIDSIEEMGLGILLATSVLLVLGRIGPAQHLDEILGKIVVEAMTAAIGVSVGTTQLGGEKETRRQPRPKSDTRRGVSEAGVSEAGVSEAGIPGADFSSQIVVGFCGAVLFAANIAPTEEVIIIGTQISPVHAVALAVLSLGIGGGILYYSNFRGAHLWSRADNRLTVFRGTVVTYLVALAASAMILWLYGRFDGVSLGVIVHETIVLGFGSTLGASAGRLLLQA